MKRGENIQNLKPFKKGYDSRRNYKGAPKLKDIKEYIAEVANEDENMLEVVKMLFKQARKGNVRAAQEIFDRYYHKATQPVDHTTGGKELNQIKVNIYQEDVNL